MDVEPQVADDEWVVVLTPGQDARKTAYTIDPLMAAHKRVVQPSRPCRVNGEVDAGLLWQERAQGWGKRAGAVIFCLAVLAPIVTPSRHADAQPAPAKTINASCATVKLGSSGQAVTEVQFWLRANGWTITVDGDFGPQTDRVVRAFQRVNGLDADGIVGPLTRRAMSCGRETTAPPTIAPRTQAVHVPALTRGSGVSRWKSTALAAGWTRAQWPTVACIIQRESRGQPGVVNSAGATGLMQIMRRYYPGVNLRDPFTNLRIGHRLFLQRGWQPWTLPGHQCA
jgi:hypothetical protein